MLTVGLHTKLGGLGPRQEDGIQPTSDLDETLSAYDAIRRAADQDSAAWLLRANPQEGVGSRHHTVPAMLLRHFAHDDQLCVRRLGNETPRLTNLKDLAQKDFYTTVSDDPAGGPPFFDGRIEQILSVVEGNAGDAFRRLRNPLVNGKALPHGERLALDQFLAFQLVRGVRTRREQELMADAMVKMYSQLDPDGDRDVPDLAEVARMRVVPHPNEHLRLLGPMAQQAMSVLIDRPLTLVEIDQPLFWTADEPVVVFGADADGGHAADCFLSERQRRRRHRRIAAAGATEFTELVHMRLTRPRGLATAEFIAMPLDPRRLILLGPRGVGGPSYLRYEGADAQAVAAEISRELLTQGYSWFAAHPEHPSFPTHPLPEPGPILEMCDGGSPVSVALRLPPSPRQPERLRRDWT